MNQFSPSVIKNLPEEKGIFCFLNKGGKTVFVGAAENIKDEASRILSEKKSLAGEVHRSEIINRREKDLIKIYAQIVRQKKPLYNLNLGEQKLFPFFKITREEYPRLLITRKIQSDNAEYFGAFLPETKSRFLLDFLIKTFRLRGCSLEINGDFPVPCTQFYEKKCVAPCVESLCNKTAYDQRVKLLKLFLANDEENFERLILHNIESAAEGLDFETATRWRDFLHSAQGVWRSKDMHVRLDDTNDSFEIKEKSGQIFLFLISQRGRRILSRRVFVFEKISDFSVQEFLSQILWQIYEFYAPKEIRVTTDFADRKFLSKVLSQRANRQIQINVVAEDVTKKTTASAFNRTKFEYDLKKIKPVPDLSEIRTELKNMFDLSGKINRIVAFDVAHIAGTNFVAAKAVWESGKFLANEYEFWLSDEKSELAALEQGIKKGIKSNKNLPDLVLIDGGKPQLSAAFKALDQWKSRNFTLIAVVKPPGKHNEVSHFIKENGEVVKMNSDSDAFQILARIRDEAHNLSNSVHRLRRDSTHFYELANVLPSLNENERRILLQKFGSFKQLKQAEKIKIDKVLGLKRADIAFSDLQKASDTKTEPLIVLIRYTDENGDAEDLQPLSFMRNK
jgi:excinuclease ABC subunit C